MEGLAGKVAIVTGAGLGIGQEIAKRLGREGVKIVVSYTGAPAGADETRRAISDAGGEAEIVLADITDGDRIRNVVDTAWSRFGSADILVNNAGMEHRSDFWDTKESEYDEVMTVNLRGPFFLTQQFVRRLRDAKRPGRIVNISSVHEDMAFPGYSAYCCSEGAIRMMMRNLAVELGPLGITVNNVAPGIVRPPIEAPQLTDKTLLKNIPLGSLIPPDEVAAAVAYLLSNEASCVNGATFVIDGGMMRSYHEQ